MNLPRTTALALMCLLLIPGLIPLVQANCTDNASDGSCCYTRFNLQPENLEYVAAPTVVDINETTGNLLVRGPLPLVIRNGPGNDPNQSPCMNHSDWRFAYEELNTIMPSRLSPAYFTDAQRDRLARALHPFNLSDYQLIVVSLIDDGDVDNAYLMVEKNEFGGNFSHCSAPLNPGTIPGQQGYLIWSPVGFCSSGDCHDLLYTDNDRYCSYYNLIEQIRTLMEGTDPSGKKRLIYYHCVLGTDRTGGVTIGYLLRINPEMTYCQALTYTQYLGKTSPPPQWIPNPASQNLAHAYCNAINGRCTTCSSEMISDSSESPVVALAQPGGEAGSPVNYIFEDYDDTDGSSSTADSAIHHIHVIPSAAIVEPILRVLPAPRIGEESKLAGHAFAIYYDIDILNVPETSIDPSFIQFSLREQHLQSVWVGPDDVVMMRWVEDRWEELPTVLDHITRGRAFYTAETSGFSYFVITNRCAVPVVSAIPEDSVSPLVPETAREAHPPTSSVPSVQVPVPEPATINVPVIPAAEVTPPSAIPLPAVIMVAGLVTGGGYLIRRWWIRRQNPELFRKND